MPAIGMKAFFSTAALCLINWVDDAKALASHLADMSNLPSFYWAALEPLSDLRWHDCYSAPSFQDSTQHILPPPSTSKSRKFSPARLSIPLDYHNTTNHHSVGIPILKLSASPSASHRCIIFMGLCGVGNSYVKDFSTLTSSDYFLKVIDLESEYGFLTFDNRGFGYSFPRAKCFDKVLDSTLWEQRMGDFVVP